MKNRLSLCFLVHINRIALYLDVVLQPLAGHGGHQLEPLGELELDADVLEQLIVEGVGAVELEDLRIKDKILHSLSQGFEFRQFQFLKWIRDSRPQ